MPARVRLELGDGDDWNSFASDYPANLPVEVYGGDGKDQLQTYDGGDHVTLDGGGGNDILKGWQSNETLRGGAGDDEINGSGGDDHIEGGDGNDSISPDTYYGPGNDYVDGGAGIDTVDDWSIPSNDYHPPISVSMDGVANDGRTSAGEADNVVNVERITSSVSGTLSGSAGDDEFRVWANVNEGNSTLLGNGGNDKLTAGDYQDTLDGGAGNDVINGGFGNDVRDRRPGPGHDLRRRHQRLVRLVLLHVQDPVRQRRRQRPRRRGGHDRLRRRRGPRDRRRDRRRRQLRDGRRAGAAARPGSAPAGNTDSTPAPTFAYKLKGTKLSLTVPCAGACKVSATLTVKKKTIGKASKTLLKAGDAKLTVKVKKQRKTVNATLKVTVEAADGTKASATKTVKVKR